MLNLVEPRTFLPTDEGPLFGLRSFKPRTPHMGGGGCVAACAWWWPFTEAFAEKPSAGCSCLTGKAGAASAFVPSVSAASPAALSDDSRPPRSATSRAVEPHTSLRVDGGWFLIFHSSATASHWEGGVCLVASSWWWPSAGCFARVRVKPHVPPGEAGAEPSPAPAATTAPPRPARRVAATRSPLGRRGPACPLPLVLLATSSAGQIPPRIALCRAVEPHTSFRVDGGWFLVFRSSKPPAPHGGGGRGLATGTSCRMARGCVQGPGSSCARLTREAWPPTTTPAVAAAPGVAAASRACPPHAAQERRGQVRLLPLTEFAAPSAARPLMVESSRSVKPHTSLPMDGGWFLLFRWFRPLVMLVTSSSSSSPLRVASNRIAALELLATSSAGPRTLRVNSIRAVKPRTSMRVDGGCFFSLRTSKPRTLHEGSGGWLVACSWCCTYTVAFM